MVPLLQAGDATQGRLVGVDVDASSGCRCCRAWWQYSDVEWKAKQQGGCDCTGKKSTERQ